MRNSWRKALVLSSMVMLSSGYIGDRDLDNSKLYIPDEIHITFKKEGALYRASVEFDYMNQKIKIPYQYDFNWRTFLSGQLDLTKVKP